MAVKYWVSKAPGGWSGSRGAGTETSPYDGALGVQAAIGSGISPGDTVIFMGEYGPVLVAEINADFPQTAGIAIGSPLVNPSFGAAHASLTNAGGIVWGDSYDGTSGTKDCRDITFQFRGDYPYHIDARGATGVTANRMRAGLWINGVRNTVDGLRLAAPNWNYIDTGRVTPATALTSTYAAESSIENMGLVMNGAWGCAVRNCTLWGSDAFGREVLFIRHVFIDTANQVDATTIVENNTISGGYYNVYIGADPTNYSGVYPARATPDPTYTFIMRNNRIGQARWGDTATTPVINNSMNHAGQLSVQNILNVYSQMLIYDNDITGDCQDAIELVAVGVSFYDNYVHDICTNYAGGLNYTYWYNNAGSWATTTGSTQGNGIKVGWGQTGTITGAVWPSLGAVGTGAYVIPGNRHKVYRNRFINIMSPGASINLNSAPGSIIACNEIYSSGSGSAGQGINSNRALSAATDVLPYFIVNNYIQTRPGGIGINATQYNQLWLYNNIVNSGAGGTDVSTFNATAVTNLYGGNNRFAGASTVNLGSFGVNNMTGNTTGAANYTIGLGPTAGGNCATQGSWEGIFGARSIATLRDLSGSAFNGTVPVGPYKP
jgi:hypothetical protein